MQKVKQIVPPLLLQAALWLGAFAFPSNASAQSFFDTLFGQSNQGIKNPAVGNLGNDPVAANSGSIFLTYFVYIWRALITIGGLLVLFYLIWGAIEWITAAGDQSKIGKARDKMTQSIIGMVVLTASFTIVTFLSRLLFGENFNLLMLTLPDVT